MPIFYKKIMFIYIYICCTKGIEVIRTPKSYLEQLAIVLSCQ